jgi:hypothetical protein
MAQSTLLDSTKEKAGKFSVSVERVVNLGNYETLRIGLAEVLDLASEKPEDAYARIMQKVDGWTSQLKPAKPTTNTVVKPVAPVAQSAILPSEPVKPIGMEVPHPTKPQFITCDKSEPTVTGQDHYLELPWKQSQKKQTLATIHVTPELLQNPLARDLYDKVKEWKNLHVGHVAYRYSKMDNGTEFLQKWSPAKLD